MEIPKYLNQIFYRSQRWKSVRDKVIIRDNGCDLGVEGHEIYGKIIIHHMNPITIKDFIEQNRAKGKNIDTLSAFFVFLKL